MTFKNLHKRASTPHHRRAETVAPLLGGATTTAAAPTTTSTSSYIGHAPIEPTGPPLVLTTTTTTSQSSSSVSTSASSSSSSVSSSATTSLSTSTTAVQTTVAAATSARTTAAADTVVRSTVHVTATSTTGSATATSTPDSDSSGPSVGTVAGIAAAALIAIGVLTVFLIWFLRRRNKNHDIDEEPFNRNSFLRNSTVIPDDDAPLPSRTRPAPTMTERQPTPVYGAAQTYTDMGQNAFGYNTQPSYGVQPGQTFNPLYGPGGAPATPLPYSPGFGTAYDPQGFNNGGYADLTRGGPTHEYPPSPRGYEQYESPRSPFVGHDNFPVPPAIPAGSASVSDSVHYPELTPATVSVQQGQVVSVRDSVYKGRETPVQLGFTPAGAPAQAHQGHAPVHGVRPDSVYDTDDAYGGI